MPPGQFPPMNRTLLDFAIVASVLAMVVLALVAMPVHAGMSATISAKPEATAMVTFHIGVKP